MSPTIVRGSCVTALLLAVAGQSFAQDAAKPAKEQEAELIAVLKSGASREDKANACRKLALVGTRECVPALAALLGDEALAHMARYALEPIPDPAVQHGAARRAREGQGPAARRRHREHRGAPRRQGHRAARRAAQGPRCRRRPGGREGAGPDRFGSGDQGPGGRPGGRLTGGPSGVLRGPLPRRRRTGGVRPDRRCAGDLREADAGRRPAPGPRWCRARPTSSAPSGRKGCSRPPPRPPSEGTRR